MIIVKINGIELSYKAVFLCKNGNSVFMVERAIKERDVFSIEEFLKNKNIATAGIPMLDGLDVWDKFLKKLDKGDKVNMVYNLVKDILHGRII